VPEAATVHAAGAVVWRRDDGDELEVLLVHRPRYDDWSLPKGKLDDGESHEAAAAREVREETGVSGALGAELAPIAYTDGKGRPKVVRYWLMHADEAEPRPPDDEVDGLRWVPIEDAPALLSYKHDAAVVAEARNHLR
jgi:8-oxo-dGTP diphosphatase